MRIISVSDLETDTFYQEVPDFLDLTGITKNYAEGSLDLRWGGTDRWYRADANSNSYQLRLMVRPLAWIWTLFQKRPLMVGGMA